MDPVIGSALISAGSSLFGGLFGKKKGPSTYQQTQEAMGAQAKYAREYGEQYGFDPLTLLGVSSPVAGGQIMDNPMGQAIADAGMILADAWSKRTDAQKLQRSKERINELQTKLDHQTLRPKVGGVYAKREMSPMLRPSNGGANERVGGSSGLPDLPDGAADYSNRSGQPDVLRPLPDRLASDPRREVDNDKQKTHSGFMVVDNPSFDYPIYVPTMDGDEAAGLLDLVSFGAYQQASKFYHNNHAVVGPARDDQLYIDRAALKSKRPKARPNPRPKMAGGKVSSPKGSAGKLPFQP